MLPALLAKRAGCDDHLLPARTLMHAEQAIAALHFDPLLPIWLIAGLGAVALLAVVLAAIRRARGTILRLAAFAVLLLWLAGPRLVQETRETLPDIGLLVVDHTASMQVGDRAALAEAARQSIVQQAAKLPDLDLRTIVVPESGDAGTRLFAEIDRALGDIPRGRLAGETSPIYDRCNGLGSPDGAVNLSPDCGVVIEAQVFGLRDNPALADRLDVGVVDQANGYAAITATEQGLAAMDAQRRADQVKQASKNAQAPSL